MAARELLHNPPDAAASPDALRQWRDDIDCLLNLAQVTQAQRGDLCPDSIIVKVAHPALCTPHQ
jgi:hypothetical protein